ncbi:ribosomal protection-like ABC-F family protein [Helicobacter cappadocius]|uniref:ABC-F family ATP-binding cassette domain-containing protein n=1 Tax=Helicobacter cappadocius TaxID=3063998 RepID=A0AA90PLJ6_9HELI|nr:MULTISPECIES: ABC-F family ATP-binding cassette domain-containing protein [unclassified Helicobacter]MDO7253467.1 ABC-F family ATP-binding cassette domain-containing protein [Helicobacter sp. faydin-H75]MDP2539394.1 ABC-F family ATP-binding cassette domain-containing protein [Helicobacter sp. faydin-H76]
MALVSLLGVCKQYDYKVILKDINFSITKGEKIAIVGKNGSGKSTLLKILTKEIEPDEGERIFQNNIKILSLPQNPIFDPLMSVRDVCEESLAELRDAHKRLEFLNTQESTKDMLEEQGAIISFIEEHHGWDMDSKVDEILQRFDLENIADRLANTLSGGEQKRLALSVMLLKSADILILDEPTNHLDVQMVEFLEEMISSLTCSVVFISHDRYFIESLAHRVVEIDDGKLLSFQGGYSNYLQKKEEILNTLSKEHEHLLKLLKSEEEWLHRGVQGRRKRNEGRKARVLEMRKNAKANPSIIKKMRLELQREQKHFNRDEGKNTKKMLFECEKINKKIADKVLISDLSLRILQRDKIAIVGKNGSGKSTLLKIFLNQISQDSGIIKRGDITIGYFDQQRKMLDEDKNLLETFCPNGGDHIEVKGKNIHVFGYLKNFLFPKEFLDKKISYLSGGEKNRVALALLFAKKYDCLILDEPTNDLDIATINVLEEYLQNFDGAVIFVSHDRYFVDKIAHKLLVFKGNGICEESYMQYTEYLDIQKELDEYDILELDLKDNQKNEKIKKNTKLSYKEAMELEFLPSEIEKLEKIIKSLELELEDPNIYEKKGIATIAKEMQETQKELESKLEKYFFLEEKHHILTQGN